MLTDQPLLLLLTGALAGAGLATAVLAPSMASARREARRWRRLAREVRERSRRSYRPPSPASEDEAFTSFSRLTDDLLQDERRLRTVLNSLTDGLALLDAQGNVIFCNPAFTAMFPSSGERTVSQDAFSIDTAQEFLQAAETTRSTKQVSTVDLRLATTPPRDILVTLTPYEDPNLKDAVILTATDVTDRKRVEQMRTEFVANVSHELRTPLAAIRGYVETCLEPPEDGSQPPYERFLPIVHQHAMRLNALIEDLLILSRIESKAITLNMQPIQLAAAVESAVATLAPQAEKKRLLLVNALPPNLPNVRADATGLERILLNLIENGIKYSDEQSEVRITARLQPGMVCVMVQDRGIGIPKEDQTRVFERFYRVDKARSRKAGGTGLGLSIVKHLVQSHGGEVWVDSEPGRGSTFFFTLPLAR